MKNIILISLLCTFLLPGMERQKEKQRVKQQKSASQIKKQVLDGKSEKKILEDIAHYFPLNETDVLVLSGKYGTRVLDVKNQQVKAPPLLPCSYKWQCCIGKKRYLISKPKRKRKSNKVIYKVKIVDLSLFDDTQWDLRKSPKVYISLPYIDATEWHDKIILSAANGLYIINAKTFELEDRWFLESERNLKVYGNCLMGSKKFEESYKIELELFFYKRYLIEVAVGRHYELVDFFYIGRKLIGIFNQSEKDVSEIKMWDIKKQTRKRSIEAYKIPIKCKPLLYKNRFIITVAGSLIRIFDLNLNKVQQIQLKRKNYQFEQFWITGDYLCAKIKKFNPPGFNHFYISPFSQVVRWELLPQVKEQKQEIIFPKKQHIHLTLFKKKNDTLQSYPSTHFQYSQGF